MITAFPAGRGGAVNGFRKFILRGNAVDLAVGVVIGAAFGAVVNQLVKGVINPIVGLLGSQNFDQYSWCIHGACSEKAGVPTGHVLLYGNVITALVTFLLTAAAVYYFVVLPVGHLLDRVQMAEAPTHKECPECLSSIPIAAVRCAFCTVEQVET
jgi:large conductance mechanosensitive channel